MDPITACRVLPHESADGPTNMARDEALLDEVSRDPTSAVFRTYGWTEPTLSLGYFQSIAEAEAEPRWGPVPIVRRPTGGGAIWHDHEVTYALAVPRGHRLARQNSGLYQAVHAAISATLAELGVDARRRGGTESSGNGRRPFLCFTDRDPEDLIVGSAKVVGSAQRRRSGGLLQHGSILLRRSPQAPELPGVSDLTTAASDAPVWAKAVSSRVPGAIGLVAEISDWPDTILSRASQLEQTIYRDSGWTRRR